MPIGVSAEGAVVVSFGSGDVHMEAGTADCEGKPGALWLVQGPPGEVGRKSKEAQVPETCQLVLLFGSVAAIDCVLGQLTRIRAAMVAARYGLRNGTTYGERYGAWEEAGRVLGWGEAR